MAKLALFVISDLLLVLLLVAGAKSSRLTLFDQPNYQTVIFDEEVETDCKDLVPINDKAASARTTGNCVYIYEHYGCTGRRTRVSPQYPIQDLANARLNRLVSSVRACCPPIPGIGSTCRGPNDVSSDTSFVQTAKLLIYDNFDHNDFIHEMVPTEECSNLEARLNDRASSVFIGATCVILYQHYDCSGPHITLFPGSNFHNNLAKLNFDNNLSSVRACCEQRNWAGFDPTSPIVA